MEDSWATERGVRNEATSPTRKPIEDFDPELSAVFNRAFPDPLELEDLLYRRSEKGLPLKGK